MHFPAVHISAANQSLLTMLLGGAFAGWIAARFVQAHPSERSVPLSLGWLAPILAIGCSGNWAFIGVPVSRGLLLTQQ